MVKKNTVVRNIALVFIVLILMAVIVFLVGRSFGFFNYSKKGQVLNVVTINGLDVRILNNSNNALNLEAAYPMYDSQGMEQDSFDFSIENTSSKSLDFSLKVVNDTDKQSECVLEDGNDTPCTLLSTNYIRYSYKINNGSWSAPANLGTNNNIVFADAISGKEVMNVSIKIWIDQNAGNSVQNNYFFGKLIIEGTKTTSNKVKVTFDDNINLVYGLDDTNNIESGFSASWSITNGILEQTAMTDDGYAFNSGRVYLEAGKTYVFNCDTDGEWTEVDVATQFNNINDTVEAFIMKDGNFSKYYRFSSNNNFEFTPDTTGIFYLRFDVNEINKTYHFWNISIKEKKDYGVKHVTVGQTYGDLPTPTREGYTFKGWSLAPNGYQKVEYIESNGSQYIDTGVYADINTIIKFETMCTDTRTTSTYSQITGARDFYRSSSGIQVAFNISTDKIAIDYGTKGLVSGPAVSKNVKIEVNVENNNILINGDYYEQAGVFSGTSPYSLWIFDDNDHGVGESPYRGRIYWYKITNSNGLVRNYIPVLNIQTGVAGLYDLALGKFYPDLKGNNFAYGTVEYINSSTTVAQDQDHTLTAVWEKNQ